MYEVGASSTPTIAGFGNNRGISIGGTYEGGGGTYKGTSGGTNKDIYSIGCIFKGIFGGTFQGIFGGTFKGIFGGTVKGNSGGTYKGIFRPRGIGGTYRDSGASGGICIFGTSDTFSFGGTVGGTNNGIFKDIGTNNA